MTRQELGMLEAARTACLAALQAVESVIARDDEAANESAENPWGTFDSEPDPTPTTGARNGRKK
jgi:hypothetical protein